MSQIVNKGNSANVNNKINVQEVLFGLQYNTTLNTPEDFYLDLVILPTDENMQVTNKEEIVYLSNRILHNGKQGDDGEAVKFFVDDEVIYSREMKGKDKQQALIKLNQIPRTIKSFIFAIGIYREDEVKDYKFDEINELKIRITNKENWEELIETPAYPKNYFNDEGALVLGKMYRETDNPNNWIYTNMSMGFMGNIGDIIHLFSESN